MNSARDLKLKSLMRSTLHPHNPLSSQGPFSASIMPATLRRPHARARSSVALRDGCVWGSPSQMPSTAQTYWLCQRPCCSPPSCFPTADSPAATAPRGDACRQTGWVTGRRDWLKAHPRPGQFTTSGAPPARPHEGAGGTPVPPPHNSPGARLGRAVRGWGGGSGAAGPAPAPAPAPAPGPRCPPRGWRRRGVPDGLYISGCNGSAGRPERRGGEAAVGTMATGAGQGLTALLLLLLLRQCEVSGRESACARPCVGRCPAEPPRCAPGVPAVLDGCSCCLVCARQRGESCSALLPCDESSGLYCDRGPEDGGGASGICMVLEGDNCVFDGMIYRNGETFQPSCKYQCTCRDGQIGCLPRCNLDLLLPGPDCPFPRKVEVPGECCEKWICDPKDEVILGGFAMAAYRQEATLGIGVSDSSANCIEQTTEWSACSKSCGIGFSTRVTNRNQQCEMVKQTRLCMIRPCENEEPFDKKGKKCIRTKKSLKAIRFEYKNCTSVQTYKPRYCGLCNDGRCCTPHSTKTIQVEFRCPQGKVLKKPMMLINTCVCHNNCPQSNIVFFQPLDPTSNEAKI